jgi:hypothetical protein
LWCKKWQKVLKWQAQPSLRIDYSKEAGMTYKENFSYPLIEGDITPKRYYKFITQ